MGEREAAANALPERVHAERRILAASELSSDLERHPTLRHRRNWQRELALKKDGRLFGAGEMIGFVRLMAFLALYVIGFGLIFALIGP
jgi:hypothetical protein